ncbi:hypothetical protein BGW37DRAFT_503892 [Umbelopsis sp. PMI_123]|nr:hypothetical protein BGW37DRAFT_503892 [Umbelopsis sp. PMI_123]
MEWLLTVTLFLLSSFIILRFKRMEIPLTIIHPPIYRSQIKSIEYRINSVMQDLGFCLPSNDWHGTDPSNYDDEVTFEPISVPYSPNANLLPRRTLPTGDEFLKLLRLSDRLPNFHSYDSETKAIPSCQTISLEEFFDPLTSNYCDQQYLYLQLQDTLIDIFSYRHVGCYQLYIGDQEMTYIMGYLAPTTKDQTTGWLIGLKLRTDSL